MNILIVGGAGMVGRKLTERLAKEGTLAGDESAYTTGQIFLVDGGFAL